MCVNILVDHAILENASGLEEWDPATDIAQKARFLATLVESLNGGPPPDLDRNVSKLRNDIGIANSGLLLKQFPVALLALNDPRFFPC
jgi:hypothetical protein